MPNKCWFCFLTKSNWYCTLPSSVTKNGLYIFYGDIFIRTQFARMMRHKIGNYLISAPNRQHQILKKWIGFDWRTARKKLEKSRKNRKRIMYCNCENISIFFLVSGFFVDFHLFWLNFVTQRLIFCTST